jgi:hypothetical protein
MEWILPTQRPVPLLRTAMRGCGRGALPAVFGAIITLAGCTGPGPVVGLKSDEVAGRIQAMKLAAQNRDAAAVPDLVTALASDDPAERLYAIEALHRITGQTLGYHYYDPEAKRAEAIQRWKDRLAGPQTKRASN